MVMDNVEKKESVEKIVPVNDFPFTGAIFVINMLISISHIIIIISRPSFQNF